LPAHPATYEFGLLYCVVKISTAWIGVALAQHATLSSCLIIAIHCGLIGYLLLVKRLVHSFMNRFNIFGSVHTIISFLCALNARRLGDASSDASVAVFAWAALGAVALFVSIELKLHLGVGRQIARPFQQVYACAEPGVQYSTEDEDKPGSKMMDWPWMGGASGFKMREADKLAWLAEGKPLPEPKLFDGKGLGVDSEGKSCHESRRPCERLGAELDGASA